MLYIPNISTFDTSNIKNINDIFYHWSSLLFLPIISNLNINKIAGYLPNISKRNIDNVEKKDNNEWDW